MRLLNDTSSAHFRLWLKEEEKSSATQSKYLHDLRTFTAWLDGRELTKAEVLAYKSKLMTEYAPTSVNGILSSLNSFFVCVERYDLRVRLLKIQKDTYLDSEKELTKTEYARLLKAAQKTGKRRLYWLMQTICSTGIRVSELRFWTVEAVRQGYADIACKGKRRRVWLPTDLQRALKRYLSEEKIKSGPVFITKSGRPLDRSNIWSEMKKLCRTAGVSGKKVFPHNLRHLFARTHYTAYKDIVRLADILGHTSVNTTRIYTMESGETHCRQIQRLGLVAIPNETQ